MSRDQRRPAWADESAPSLPGRSAWPADGEEAVRRLVFTFYDRVRDDDVLGPIFESRLEGRWEAHLEKMCDFWSSVLYATGRFRGDPVGTHASIGGISGEHFDRWIELFEEAAFEVLAPASATDIVARSRRMRVALERTACPAAQAGP